MKASVIVPAYNSEKTIFECINALLQQENSFEYEIIIVDDGSTDNTSKIIKNINSKRLKYSWQKNSGPAKARNLGAKKAKGEIIIFTDSDCIATKNWLSEMIKPFKDKKIVAVQGAYKTKQKNLIGKFGQIEIEERYEKMKKSKKLDWVGSYSAAYRRELFNKLKGFDESFPIASGEDPELSYRVQKTGGKIVFNEKAIVYHTHPKNLAKYLKTKFFRAYYRPLMYSKHKDKIINDSYTPQELKLQILCIYGIIAFVFLGIILAEALMLALGLIILHLLLGAKLFLFALTKDWKVALVSPIILLLRSVVFGAGLIWGKLNG